ncbi:MAG: birA [Candidatus Midichloriaceae bacterium]|jgi:BirA family biotin operon repressor/biotin-[acetyl-CoA-carboxylase] ligase|nr:birA [Candidatus Midichloriaceae bacterium]
MIHDFSLLRLSEVTSTQDIAKDLYDKGRLTSPTVIAATSQTHGRGRYTRTWLSPQGGLYCSIGFIPDVSMEKYSQISYIVGISICEAIMQIESSITPKLKWVNDVMIEDKKVAGILLELHGDALIIGLGLNLSRDDQITDLMGTSLSEYSKKFELERTLNTFLNRFKYNYNLWYEKGFEPIRNLWLKMAYGVGKNITVNMRNKSDTGIFVGIDEDGMLQLLSNDSIKPISAGDVFFNV